MKRIGLVTPGFSASADDWSIPALLNSVRLLARDHDVHVFTLRYPHTTWPYQVYGAWVHPLGVTHTRAGWYRVTTILRGVASILRQGRFDVLHAFWADEPGVVAALSGMVTRTPVIVSLMGGELAQLTSIDYGGQLSGLMRRMVKFSTSQAASVTAGSDWLADRAPFPTQVIPLGVDAELFKPDGEMIQLDGSPKLLHVASLSPVKNQGMLLQAIAMLVQRLPDVQLHVVGSGPELDRLQTQAGAIGVHGHVTFHGDVPHHELPAYYRAADICLLTSFYESQSMVALEAAACKKVTVGTQVGILPQLTSRDYLVDAGDHDGLANVVQRLWDNPSTLEELSEEVFQHVQERYTITHQIERWLALYDSVKRG